MRAQVREQRGRIGPVRAKPFLFALRRRAGIVEHLVAEIGKHFQVARPRDGKPRDADAMFDRGTRGQRVLPRHVVARGGGEDGDVVTGREMLGELAAVHLRSARDAGAVSLDDEGEFH